jgi:muconolactone delta-isomerase
MEIATIMDVESIQELDELLEGLPIWPRMHTSVRQLIAFDDQIVDIRSRLSRIKTKLQKG